MRRKLPVAAGGSVELLHDGRGDAVYVHDAEAEADHDDG